MFTGQLYLQVFDNYLLKMEWANEFPTNFPLSLISLLLSPLYSVPSTEFVWDIGSHLLKKFFPNPSSLSVFYLKIMWLFYTLHLYLLMSHSVPFIPQPTESRPYSKEKAYDFQKEESPMTCSAEWKLSVYYYYWTSCLI